MAESDETRPQDPMERAKLRLERPDGIVFRSDREIVETIKPFVVALTGPIGLGSGVLVRLWDRFFILTAGHVVSDVERSRAPVQLVIAESIHNAQFELPQRRFVWNQDADFGFFELHPHDAARVTARDKIFATDRWIYVADTIGEDDLYVASGFPEALVTGTEQRWLRFTCWLTSAAGTRKVPPSIAPNPLGTRALDLCVDSKVGVALDFRKRDEPAEILRLKPQIDPMPGVSGGPCWRTFSVDEPTTWTPQRLRLVATHCGRLNVPHEGESYQFARQIGIGHHLNLICDTCPDLRDRILGAWPAVEDYGFGDRGRS
jgi:hypothetical protein